ncbi:hypothetical protein F5882DRAFT_374343 [Hyaloscypha sp. PMI_1271]|nr:hypothetical protein F5882DRAFT_374343 [Hyaloscypha sp. PMI_1271]
MDEKENEIVVRKGDKGGGGGDFEIQVFSTASNLPNDLGTEPRLRTLDRHEKRTNLSLKLVKNEESFMRGTAERVLFRPSRTLAYWTTSPEAPHRLSACEESEYAICGATCEEGWGARKSRTSEKCDVENREKLWLDGGEQVEEWNLGQMLKLPCRRNLVNLAQPVPFPAALDHPYQIPTLRPAGENARLDERHLRYPFTMS